MLLSRPLRGLAQAVRIALALAVIGLAASALADDPPPLEYRVKAAFLLKFTSFVEWPSTAFADSQSPFAICLWDEDPFGIVLDQMTAGERMNGRRLLVRRIHEVPEPQACQILFVEDPTKDIRRVLSSLGPGVLTIGEGENFLRDGGVIGFVIDDRRVRFDINQKAAGVEQLAISSRLLGVARKVER